jgi:hypothetical protein
MEPDYFDTHFKAYPLGTIWPASFAIITAYQTTGEQWSDTRNDTANKELEQKLLHLGCSLIPITGYSHKTQYGEPGFAIQISLQDALKIGADYKQDAIYYVEHGTLQVHSCVKPESATVDTFTNRLTPNNNPK